ncbi:sugar transferase [Flavobacterium sp. HSC-61S13]|uniref:sugar transferase n=1 Tax=Flavobacterium sp. HSC-61S13 TaxID=2910963 RepID=UPI002111B71F|nr:sugar transferase [Flavobacterium sp. HSC-61S13]MCP1997561.1 lipopolysaccharide/colanic/teichoic acid biosynthesis glycosyltransferase [Flavobacterium sp. HSC-61S13]
MIKRFFDLFFALILLAFVAIPLLFAWVLASIDTRSNGLFRQIRIGQYGHPFTIYKLKTMKANSGDKSQIVTALGSFFRKTKIDELPQLINIIKGDMSVVGPRPDVPGYYDLLVGDNRQLLNLKPGLTSEASLKYYNEAQILKLQEDPLRYNDEVIFPDKIKMNLEYLQKQSFLIDIKIIAKTLFR